jgi:hypothetical protein
MGVVPRFLFVADHHGPNERGEPAGVKPMPRTRSQHLLRERQRVPGEFDGPQFREGDARHFGVDVGIVIARHAGLIALRTRLA